MGNEEIAASAFRSALAGRPIDQLAQVKDISRKTSPHNWVTLARAALVLAGKTPAADFNPLVSRTSTEFGSGLYDFSWSLCTYARVRTREAKDAYTAMLAATALCLCPAKRIGMRDLTGDHERPRNYGMANYRGPISMMPGNRMTWDTAEASFYAERSIAAPLAAWSLGQSWGWRGDEHPTLGWAMSAARGGHQVNLPQEPGRLVAVVGGLRMRPNQRLEILHLPGGKLFALLNQSTFETRGPVLVTEYDPQRRLLRQISPATQTGRGQWTGCQARLESDGRWATWQSGNETKRIDGRLDAEPVLHIVWDQDGCRLVDRVNPPNEPTSPPPPPPSDPPGPPQPPADQDDLLPELPPELSKALLLFDQLLTQLGQQGHPDREARGRTLVEILRRVISGSRSSAREGAVTLLKDMVSNGW